MVKRVELPGLLELISGLPMSDIEALTIRAIRTHRRLIENAETQFRDLSEDCKSMDFQSSAQHLSYVEAEIEMWTQAAVVSTLVDVMGYIPDVLDDPEHSRH